jgi:broad specificity phosphatase PhoE
MPITLYFETHSTSLDNEAKRASGHYDVALSPAGEAQARELGLRYVDQALAVVICSDLQRSYRTGEIAFTGRDLRIVRDARLRECDYGDLVLHPTDIIDAWRVSRITEPFPNGESYTDCAKRMAALLEDIRREYAEKTVLLIGHRATHYALDHLLNGETLLEAITKPFEWQPGWKYRL